MVQGVQCAGSVLTLPLADEPEYRELQSMLEAAPRYDLEFVG